MSGFNHTLTPDFQGSIMDTPSSTSLSLTPEPEQPNFVEQLGLQFSLTEEQVSILHGLHRIGTSLPGPISPAELMTRVFALACQYAMEQRILFALRHVDVSQGLPGPGPGDLKGVFNELAIRLDKSFQMTKDQTSNIRQLCQEQIYKPSRTVFKDLHIDVLKKLRATPEQYELQNIFGIGKPARESQVTSSTKRIASGVRNVFRQDIRDSIIGDGQTSLKKFTADCNQRYRHSSTTTSNATEQGYLIHNALLRRFAFEHKDMLVVEEVPEPSDHVEDEGPSKKRRRVSPSQTPGRKANGADFWAKVDAWFEDERLKRGDDFSSEEWKSYIEETITMDNGRFEAFQEPSLNTAPSPFSFAYQSLQRAPQGSVQMGNPFATQPSVPQPAAGSSFSGGSSMHLFLDGYLTGQRQV